MALTYEPIATTTLSSTSATITFNSIAANWTDLRLVLVAGGTSSDALRLRMNNDSATNYSFTELYGTGAAINTTQGTGQTGINPFYAFGFLSSTLPSLITFDIFSYTNSKYKFCLIQNNNDRNGAGTVQTLAGLWASTSAITRLDLVADTAFTIGTSATLYGIKAA
jgi:hypothetical protein